MNSRHFRDLAAQKVREAQALQAKADEEERTLSEEERARIESLLKEAEDAQAEAERRYKLECFVDRLEEPVPAKSRISQPGELPPALDPVPAVARDRKEEGKLGWRNFGEFALAVRDASTPSRARFDERLRIAAAASGLQQAVGSEGGFLIPPTFSVDIWDRLNDPAQSLLALTDNYTVEGESLTFPANAETSRATGSRYGGIRGYWIAEAEQITKSTPKFRQVKIEPHELAVLVYVTEKLLRNSPTALEQYLSRAASDEINFLIGDAIVNGTGAGQPLGILKSGALVTVSAQAGQAADTFLPENVVKMWARLHARSWPTAVWLVNQDVYPQLALLTHVIRNIAGNENVGGAFTALYDPEANTLNGRPVLSVEYCDTLGNVGDVILADLKGYATGTRGGVEAATSMHLRFDFAETAFRFIFSADGQPWLAAPITPFKGSNTLSTFVTLAAR